MTRRTKKEMLLLDEKIKPLYEKGMGCRLIGAQLHENHMIVYKRLKHLGLIRDSCSASRIKVLDIPNPFRQKPNSVKLRVSAIATAMQWFLHRGYMASFPVDAVRYDLITESDEGLLRIQVKTTTYQENGSWYVNIGRLTYTQEMEPTTAGKRKKTPYLESEIDYFFIVTQDNDKYLIPIKAVLGLASISLKKYKIYKV